MTRFRSVICIFGFAALAGSGLCHAADNNALKLWYRQPAAAGTLALPIGNGRLAATQAGSTPRLSFKSGHVYTVEFEKPAA